jgi:hypothetical protein
MANVSDIKPWFREDFARTLLSIYFSSKSAANQRQVKDERYQIGFAAALSSFAVAVGVNPESFLLPEDIQLLRKEQS